MWGIWYLNLYTVHEIASSDHNIPQPSKEPRVHTVIHSNTACHSSWLLVPAIGQPLADPGWATKIRIGGYWQASLKGLSVPSLSSQQWPMNLPGGVSTQACLKMACPKRDQKGSKRVEPNHWISGPIVVKPCCQPSQGVEALRVEAIRRLCLAERMDPSQYGPVTLGYVWTCQPYAFHNYCTFSSRPSLERWCMFKTWSFATICNDCYCNITIPYAQRPCPRPPKIHHPVVHPFWGHGAMRWWNLALTHSIPQYGNLHPPLRSKTWVHDL